MKLLLTSGGVTNPSIEAALVDLLGKPIAEADALCIPTAQWGHPMCGPGSVRGLVAAEPTFRHFTGLGWASQLKKDGRVTLVTFGDGASNIGAFHEALNMASLWKLPVIFLCQNNLYGESSKYAKTTSVDNIGERAASYRMAGVTVDGNDAEAMWRAAGEAVARARAGEGPTLIEAVTFRFMGHYFGDPGAYIPKEEYEAHLARDPMPATRAAVLASGAATEAELDAYDAEVSAQIEEALQFAADSPFPDVGEIDIDVYGAAA